MAKRAPIVPDRIRKICGSFSWIEHRFVHSGFLRELSRSELLLYYFLITVGDRNGVSFYDYEKICQLLKIEVDTYVQARNRLIDRQLIAYEGGVFQVLPLPERVKTIAPRPCHSPCEELLLQGEPREAGPLPHRNPEFQSFGELIKHLKENL